MQSQQEELYLDTKGQKTEVQGKKHGVRIQSYHAENQVWINNHAEKLQQ